MSQTIHTIQRGILLLALLLLGLGRAEAVVTCTPTAGLTVSMPANVTAPRDQAFGTPITAWITGPITRMENNCTANNTSTTYGQARGVLTPTGKTLVDGGVTYTVYATSLKGVGLLLAAKDVNAGKIAIGPTTTDLIKGWSTYWDFGAFVRLVATGEPIATGTLASVTVADTFVGEKSSGTTSATAPIKITAVNVSAQTCSVDAGSVNIPVNLAITSSSKLAGPIGSTDGNASFNIRLNCSSGMNVYLTLTDGNNLGNTSDTLALSPSQLQARGVGIQVRRSGTPVRFGPDSSVAGNTNQIAIGAAPNGVLNIPFTANYIKTETTVRPGEANAVATYTLSYQ